MGKKQQDIESHLQPGATWHFGKDPDCPHERTTRITIGTYADGPNSGRIYGLKCKDCGALKYE